MTQSGFLRKRLNRDLGAAVESWDYMEVQGRISCDGASNRRNVRGHRYQVLTVGRFLRQFFEEWEERRYWDALEGCSLASLHNKACNSGSSSLAHFLSL